MSLDPRLRQNTALVEVRLNKILDYDMIECCLNPAQSNDLERVLLMTPAKNRVDTALGFTGLTRKELFEQAGVVQDCDKEKTYITRWLDKSARLPLGVAFRLAKVLGVSSDVLFEYYA